MKRFDGFLHKRRGSITVLFALFMTIVAAAAALVIDVGYFLFEKSRLSTAVDAAALAGAQELAEGRPDMQGIVQQYVSDNAGDVDQLNVVVESPGFVTVTASKTVDTFFARVLGVDTQQISSSAKACMGNVTSVTGARPLGVVEQEFEYGQQYVLKEGASDGSNGNFGAIALGGNGASVYKHNLKYGYSDTVSIGDMIETEPGVMAQATCQAIDYLIASCNHTPECTYTSYNRDCPRIITVPIVNTMEVNGRSYVHVESFAAFFLEGVSQSGGHAEVTGRFLCCTSEGEITSGPSEYGLYGVMLVE